jgi:hypothetical protein
MTAKIIQLKKYRGGIKHAGAVFPQVYRVSGFGWDFDDPVAQTGIVASTKWPVGPFYTLDDTDHGSLCNTKFEPIDRLDGEDDRGWVIVRHHASETLLDGYMRAFHDMETPGFDLNIGAIVYHTEQGLFTCINRPANPGRPNRLLIFIGRTTVQLGPLAGMNIDDHKIIDPSGRELDDAIFCGRPKSEEVSG